MHRTAFLVFSSGFARARAMPTQNVIVHLPVRECEREFLPSERETGFGVAYRSMVEVQIY
jgi:hypothetical protein